MTVGRDSRHLAVGAVAMAMAMAVVVVLGPAGCARPDDAGSRAPAVVPRTIGSPRLATATLVADAAFPVALVAEADGSLLYAERLTGRVRRVDPDGHLVADAVVAVPVVGALDDQRGLLGLVRDRTGRLFAAWTRPVDGRLVVGEVGPGPARLVWVGPVSAALANGGHLALDADDRLLIGVGDLLADRSLVDDPRAPNRKVLALDPDGAADQVPVVVSSGWNNPFAVTVDAAGIPWVADNTGGDGPERVGRGDRPAGEATSLGDLGAGAAAIAPSALVALSPTRLAMCGYLSGRVDEVRIVDGRAEPTGVVLAEPCGVGLARLADGRLVLATATALLVTVVAP